MSRTKVKGCNGTGPLLASLAALFTPAAFACSPAELTPAQIIESADLIVIAKATRSKWEVSQYQPGVVGNVLSFLARLFPDAASAALYWLYLSLMRAGDESAAAEALARIDAQWTLIENGVYHELALCFRGEKDCEAILARAREAEGIDYATPAYGVAMQRFLSGDRKDARALLKEIVDRDAGTAFGRLTAEVDLARW